MLPFCCSYRRRSWDIWQMASIGLNFINDLTPKCVNSHFGKSTDFYPKPSIIPRKCFSFFSFLDKNKIMVFILFFVLREDKNGLCYRDFDLFRLSDYRSPEVNLVFATFRKSCRYLRAWRIRFSFFQFKKGFSPKRKVFFVLQKMQAEGIFRSNQ